MGAMDHHRPIRKRRKPWLPLLLVSLLVLSISADGQVRGAADGSAASNGTGIDTNKKHDDGDGGGGGDCHGGKHKHKHHHHDGSGGRDKPGTPVASNPWTVTPAGRPTSKAEAATAGGVVVVVTGTALWCLAAALALR